MVVSSRGAGTGWGDPLDDDIRKLVVMVTELGIEAEDILFNAVTALLGEGTHGALKARAAGNECELRYQLAHQLGLELLMGGRASADQARWIMELQQIGQSFRSISQNATRVAAQSLALQQSIEDTLALVGASMHLLEYLVEQTRRQVRSAIIFSTSRDRKYARMILEEAPDLQRAYNVLDSRVPAAIRERPLESYPMQQLLSIATCLESIGKLCVGIAHAVLFNPPSRY